MTVFLIIICMLIIYMLESLYGRALGSTLFRTALLILPKKHDDVKLGNTQLKKSKLHLICFED